MTKVQPSITGESAEQLERDNQTYLRGYTAGLRDARKTAAPGHAMAVFDLGVGMARAQAANRAHHKSLAESAARITTTPEGLPRSLAAARAAIDHARTLTLDCARELLRHPARPTGWTPSAAELAGFVVLKHNIMITVAEALDALVTATLEADKLTVAR